MRDWKVYIAATLLISGVLGMSGMNPVSTERVPSTTVEADFTASAESASTLELVPRHWYLKTNIPAWGLLIANLQAEMDVTDHLSVMLPVYWSGWDYGKRTLKFRTFTVLPEVRGWLRPDNQGLFAGVHGGFCYYNVAFDKDKRYQDKDGRTPAWGGGVTLGYRLPIRGRSPWQFEFSAGFGIYHLDYDTFRNGGNGYKTGNHSRTFYGLDNFAVCISYRFDQKRMRTQLKKGGGE